MFVDAWHVHGPSLPQNPVTFANGKEGNTMSTRKRSLDLDTQRFLDLFLLRRSL